jgi:hypothetical protein
MLYTSCTGQYGRKEGTLAENDVVEGLEAVLDDGVSGMEYDMPYESGVFAVGERCWFMEAVCMYGVRDDAVDSGGLGSWLFESCRAHCQYNALSNQ